jgi:ankyrin repeat protein
MNTPNALHDFLIAATVPVDGHGHTTGTLTRAEELRAANPDLAAQSPFAAAALGDHGALQSLLAADASVATAKGGPHNWDPLTYLCFSNYLRLDPARSDGFVRAATLLLDAGAKPNTGWHETHHLPNPVWESAIYGAAGVAQHAGVTRVLLERGADPNDDETPYHVPETHDNTVLRLLLDSKLLNDRSLNMLLIRKGDWHDQEGLRLVLETGADPNHVSMWGMTPLQQSVRRDNALANVATLLDHGGDPNVQGEGHHVDSAMVIAARRGRKDVLELFAARGFELKFDGPDELIAACALHDGDRARQLVAEKPEYVEAILAFQSHLLTQFAGNDNAGGIALLLELGAKIDAPLLEGDGYWEVAPLSTALHVAAWRAKHETLRFLLQRGAPVDLPDARGRTPLALAVKACVASHWTARRSPDSVQALLEAGASPRNVGYPCGYDAVDELLQPTTH